MKQANISNGPQQENNNVSGENEDIKGDASPKVAMRHARLARGKNGETTNELLDSSDRERMDAGTAGETGRSNKTLEAVGKLDGAA